MSMDRRTEWMFNVSVNRPHIIDGNKIKKWITKHIEQVTKKDEVRCVHCGGKIRLHQGPKVEWHAEHVNREDALKCPGSPEGKTIKYLKKALGVNL